MKYLRMSHRKELAKWWSLAPVRAGVEASRGLPGCQKTASETVGMPEAPVTEVVQ
jgi:hypothetical protein